jgi:hypothetical protein
MSLSPRGMSTERCVANRIFLKTEDMDEGNGVRRIHYNLLAPLQAAGHYAYQPPLPVVRSRAGDGKSFREVRASEGRHCEPENPVSTSVPVRIRYASG